nr:MAG TPA: hypothetical protein [Caudoviricetes sp.]
MDDYDLQQHIKNAQTQAALNRIVQDHATSRLETDEHRLMAESILRWPHIQAEREAEARWRQEAAFAKRRAEMWEKARAAEEAREQERREAKKHRIRNCLKALRERAPARKRKRAELRKKLAGAVKRWTKTAAQKLWRCSMAVLRKLKEARTKNNGQSAAEQQRNLENLYFVLIFVVLAIAIATR